MTDSMRSPYLEQDARNTDDAHKSTEDDFVRPGRIIEDIPFGVWVCDAQGGLQYASDSFLNLLEMSLDEASGFGWTERLITGNGDSLKRWRACVASEADWDDEHRIRDSNGNVRTLLARGHAIRDDSGEVSKWVGVHLDITRRKQEEERIRALKIVQGRHQERERISRRLHDHLQQLLIGANFQLAQLRRPQSNDERLAILDQVRELLRQSIEASRNLAVEINPPALYESGMKAALEWLADFMRETHGLVVELKMDVVENSTEGEVNIVLFDAVRELLLNVVKHANVDHATVSATQSGDVLRLIVEDGGRGFDASDFAKSDDPAAGLGLSGIRHRLETLGGHCIVHSAPERGTTVELRMRVRDP